MKSARFFMTSRPSFDYSSITLSGKRGELCMSVWSKRKDTKIVYMMRRPIFHGSILNWAGRLSGRGVCNHLEMTPPFPFMVYIDTHRVGVIMHILFTFIHVHHRNIRCRLAKNETMMCFENDFTFSRKELFSLLNISNLCPLAYLLFQVE